MPRHNLTSQWSMIAAAGDSVEVFNSSDKAKVYVASGPAPHRSRPMVPDERKIVIDLKSDLYGCSDEPGAAVIVSSSKDSGFSR